ncbi:unnamed protein product [Microthlaspi erraticum]|uniref:Uncharacterized protein n=1 Tax=Microthlaspi erraticum TaxID=1685480 RepID=A0A6D2IBZ2_9BRAS|nr:unnamed protein product [Microthlaspi erraticum]
MNMPFLEFHSAGSITHSLCFISAVFLKQHLTGLVFDSGFSGEETAVANTMVDDTATEEKMTIMEHEDVLLVAVGLFCMRKL